MSDVTPQLLRKLYVEERKSQRELARTLHCSQFKVRCLLREAGIQARSYKENKMPVPKGSHLSLAHRRAISLALGGSGELKPRKRFCKFCGKIIPPNKNNRKYCSLECYNKDRIGKPRPSSRKRIKKSVPFVEKNLKQVVELGIKKKFTVH